MKHTIKLPTEVIEFIKTIGCSINEGTGTMYFYSHLFIEETEGGEYNLLRFNELPRGVKEMVIEKNDWKIEQPKSETTLLNKTLTNNFPQDQGQFFTATVTAGGIALCSTSTDRAYLYDSEEHISATGQWHIEENNGAESQKSDDNSERFEKIVENRLGQVKQVMLIKGKEYRRNGNVYHNFDRAASMLNQIREVALVGMMAKHLVSIFDIVDDVANGKIPTEAIIDEKFGDAINYLILLEGALKERL